MRVRRREFITLLGGAAAWPLAARAQQPIPVVGFLGAPSPVPYAQYVAAVRQGLKEAGFVEGQNLAIEYRWAEGQYDRLPALAADLVSRRVAVIVVFGGAPAAAAAKAATSTIPIIFNIAADPVKLGLVASLNRPGGNITGMGTLGVELEAKRLELLREIIPGLRRVAIVANPTHPGEHLERAYTQDYGRQLGLSTDYFATTTRDELERAFAAMAKDPPQAISLFADGFAIQYRQDIIDFGLNRRVPVVSGWPVFARAGALFTYGPDLVSSYQRLAYYVDRIFKGKRTSDLPIEQPTKFEFVVNRRTAKALDIEVPTSILLHADEVIE